MDMNNMNNSFRAGQKWPQQPLNNINSFPSYMNNMMPMQANTMMTQQNTEPTNNIIWVQGIENAKAWQIPPRSRVILLDSETDGIMYIKVSDDIGMSTLRIFRYEEEKQPSETVSNEKIDLSQYVRKDELQNLLKELLHEQSISAATATTGESTKARIITKQSQSDANAVK